MFNFGKKKPYKLGIAFSGGGARGFAHAGALKALEEMGLRPDIIAGVSAGSVVCALYAGGLKPEQMLDVFANQKFSDLCQLSVPKNGFFTMEGFKRLIRESVPYSKIEELPVPTLICATDMDNGEPVVFNSGELSERVAASCCIPIVFQPIKIDGTRYIDGGVLHNLPAWAIRERCKYLIGLNCSSMPRRKYKDTLLDIAQASYNLAVKSNTRADMALCDLAIDMPEIANYKVFNLKEINKVFRQGYTITKKALLDNGFVQPHTSSPLWKNR